MTADEEIYLAELLEWVQQNEGTDEDIGAFLKAFVASHDETLYQLAEREPATALGICEMLFEMVEELYDDSEEIRERFVRTQPKPPPDPRQLL